jgi:glycosyltransferase involved in cell wall biosynthesis
MPEIAAGLARAGMLDTYVTSITSSVGGPLGLAGRMPGAPGAAARAALDRRPVPAGVPPSDIRHRASLLDVLVKLSARTPTPRLRTALYIGLSQTRNRRFDLAARRLIGPQHSALIGAYGASCASFDGAAAAGVRTFLQYPLAHHAVSERLLQEEARIQPEFAPTLQFHRFPAGLKRRLSEEISRADRIFVLCDFHRTSFIEAGVPPEKLVMTPLGVDTRLFSPRARPDDGVFRVVFVGQIGQRKGLSYLLEGFREADLPDSELLLVGPTIGPTNWLAQPRVRHLPARPRAALPSVYERSDVLVLPSLIEGFGLTPLEAMASGRPVIVSAHSLGPDVVEEGTSGYVVPIRDSAAIAERLRELHANPAMRERMGEAARRRAQRFTWEEYGRRVALAVQDDTAA